jgi:hypothetical protein
MDCSGGVCEVVKAKGLDLGYADSESLFKKSDEKFGKFASFVEMIPELREGDLIFLDSGPKKFDKGREYGIDHVGVVVKDNDGSLKLFQFQSGEGATLKPLNQALSRYDAIARNRYIGRFNSLAPAVKETTDNIEPSKREASAKSYLESKGYSPAAVAGILGNIATETGGTFDHTLKQKNGNGYGLFQFDFMRRYYEDYLKENKKTDSYQAQIDYMDDVINGRVSMMSAEKRKTLLNVLQKSNNPEEIARVFMEIFENPGVPHLEKRTKAAKEIYTRYYGNRG